MALAELRPRHRPVWIRIVAAVCVLLTAWHIFATFLWVAPASGLRDLVPGKTLSNYMLPVFGQSWSVFAPDPINGNVTIKVRAILGGDEKKPTDWVNATEAELDMTHHNLFPPRATMLGLQQATEYKQSFDKLTAAQKKTVAAGYYKGENWQERLEKAITAGVATGATKAASEKNTKTFLAQERRTAAYATQVAKAVWGSSVTAVQFQVSRQNVTPFADRDRPDAKPPAVTVLDSGWRGTFVFPGQNESLFSEVFSNLKGVK